MTVITRTLIALAVFLGLAADALAQAPIPRPPRKGTKYTVKIDSAPQQAVIYLDDKQYGIVGYTPYSGKLTKGDYKLIVELQGFKAAERVIRVDRKNREFFVALERQVQPGVIDVQAVADPNVLGAQVIVDGIPQGTAPTMIEVAQGRHQVELKKTGFHDYSQWLEVKEGQRVTLSPALRAVVVQAPKGSILVDADVPRAEVWIDGRLHADPTPTIIDDLDEGAHVVEVKKPPAVPWKQTVYVKGNNRTKIVAELSATLQQNQGGNVRVIANVEGADVYLDGTLKGKAPIDLEGIPAGVHLIEVRAKNHQPREERVSVNAGSATVLKMDLVATQTAPPVTAGKVKIVSPVPEAQVFIDGANVGTVPVEKEVAAGEHFVTVQQTGYTKFEQKIVIEAGQTVTIKAELRAIGALRFLSNPAGADVILDGAVIGKTPLLREDIDVGDHVVTFRVAGYYDYEDPGVKVEGGKLGVINATLKQIDTGPTVEDILRLKRGLTSFGARTMPLGRFTTDAALGYPYWLEARGTVGVKDTLRYGWDVNVAFRTYLTTWEFLAGARYRLFEREPFAFAVFGNVGGGGGLGGRNMFTLQGGGIASITFRNLVTVSGRAYLDAWSDRLCAEPEHPEDGDVVPTIGPEICQKVAGEYTESEAERLEELFGEEVTDAGYLQNRDGGARAYLSLVVEAAIHQRFSAFLVFEGAPFQGERPAHTHLFNEPLFEHDPIYNGKIGVTAKF